MTKIHLIYDSTGQLFLQSDVFSKTKNAHFKYTLQAFPVIEDYLGSLLWSQNRI